MKRREKKERKYKEGRGREMILSREKRKGGRSKK